MSFLIQHGGWAGDAPGVPNITGQYLKSGDHDTKDGLGFFEFTNHECEAMQFATVAEALEYWQRVSRTAPYRPDGEPNRPLTCMHAEIIGYNP